MELKCPQCQAPVYSSKAAVCGRCEAPLPVELVKVAAEHATTLERIERACREDRPVEEPGAANKPKVDPFLMANLPPELLPDVVPRNYITEFKHRKRPGFLVSAIVTMGVVGITLQLLPENAMPPFWQIGPIFLGFLALIFYSDWRSSDANCPKCGRHIQTGRIDFCYHCGKKLRGRRCPECVTDYGWLGRLAGYLNSAYGQKLDVAIRYCPGCGVELDTRMARQRPW